MAKVKNVSKKMPANNLAIRNEPLRPEEKIARMLGILALQNLKGRPEQASMLRSGGFTHKEIAEMLDTSENGVSVLLYTAKQKKEKKANASD